MRFTYKELTIAFGILIAGLVIFMLTLTNSSQTARASELVPQINIPTPSAKNITETIISFIF